MNNIDLDQSYLSLKPVLHNSQMPTHNDTNIQSLSPVPHKKII